MMNTIMAAGTMQDLLPEQVHGIGIITVPEKHNTTGTLLSHSIRTITVTGLSSSVKRLE